jgi:hypothetical protein
LHFEMSFYPYVLKVIIDRKKYDLWLLLQSNCTLFQSQLCFVI